MEDGQASHNAHLTEGRTPLEGHCFGNHRFPLSGYHCTGLFQIEGLVTCSITFWPSSGIWSARSGQIQLCMVSL